MQQSTLKQMIPSSSGYRRNLFSIRPDTCQSLRWRRSTTLVLKRCSTLCSGTRALCLKYSIECDEPKLLDNIHGQGLDLGRFSREFAYQADNLDSLNQVQKVHIVDRQTIEVANDHLCYVVTDLKTPWHLPHTKDFMLVTKIVITHVAKSKCKLAIFTYVHWSKFPRFSMNIIQRHALNDLYLDACDMMELVTDQVQKLGPHCYTKRAIDIFGHIGRNQTEVAQITSTEAINPGQPRRALIKRKTLPSLTLEIAKSLGANSTAMILDFFISIGRSLFNILSAHTLLLTVLLVSLSIHVLHSSQGVSIWWQDRSAANFMARVGVTPNSILSKAIYLSDLQAGISVQSDVVIDSNSIW